MSENKISMIEEAVKLGEAGYVAFSLKISWDTDKNQKRLDFPYKKWQKAVLPKIDNHPMVSDDYNGLAVVTGEASDIFVVDADHLKYGEQEEGLIDGVDHMQALIEERGVPEGVVIAQSASGGYHYLFSYSKSLHAGLNADVTGKTKLTIGGKRSSIDTRINNNCIIVAPTSYKTPSGTRAYQWLTSLSASASLPAAPLWLINDLNRAPAPKRGTLAFQGGPAKRANRTLAPRGPQVHFDLCKPLLSAVGFRDTRVTRIKSDGFDFVADRSCACPLCTLQHDSNEWYSVQLCQGCFEVRSYSSRCRTKLLGLETQRQLQNIFATPACDEVYVDIFAAHFSLGAHEEPVIWTGVRWLQFRDHRWRAVEGSGVRSLMVNMCVLLMERLARCLKYSEADADLLGDTSASTRAKDRYKAVLKGVAYIKKGSAQRNVMDCLKCGLFLNVGEEPSGIKGQIELDSNPYLIGCENGVIDLKTGRLRDGQPEDWMSKSIRYKYEPSTDGRNFIQHTMQQTFPVAEEREFMQRYAGYCLLGIHPEKHYVLITDLPGRRSGDNGKTTINTALRYALGPDYACAGIPASLYTSDQHRDENACTPGRMLYKGKRLATWEELDDKKKLDTSRLKSIHGGRAMDGGRDAYAGGYEQFEWTAKFLITFNIAQLPDFDFADTTHLERLLVMRCRSKFLPAAQYKGEPNTFQQIPDFVEKLAEHKSEILAWALDGLAQYWVKRLEVPAIMHTWKAELNSSQDLVTEWVQDNLEHTGNDNDFVKRAQIYQDYKAHTEEEHDKRKALGKQKFFHKLLVVLGDECHRDQVFRHHEKHRGVYLGWRHKE